MLDSDSFNRSNLEFAFKGGLYAPAGLQHWLNQVQPEKEKRAMKIPFQTYNFRQRKRRRV